MKTQKSATEIKATIHRCEWLHQGIIAKISKEEVTIPKKGRLDFLQKTVGGIIDVYHHQGRDLVINDEGISLNMPLNEYWKRKGLNLFGTVVEIHGTLD